MTTPGGVSNLPTGALTLETLASKLQDMTPVAMRQRAAERLPGTFDSSTGGNALSDLTPFGILTQLFAGFNSHVANANPSDIQGPEDLPGLLLDFIEDLPVIGELVGLLEAILGTYDGDDTVLLGVQKFFGLFRGLFDLTDGLDLDDLPSPEEAWELVVSNFINPLLDVAAAVAEALLTAPLNLANAFGKLLPFNISGLGLSQLTTAVENLLEGFITAATVPDEDGWSWDSTIGSPGSAKVVADGTTKTLYAPDVIQVDGSTKLNPLEIKVSYAGVTSAAGQTIKFVLETFSDTLGQVAVGTEVVGGITNPSGSAGPVILSFPDWSPDSGVLSILPALVVDSSVTAGSVNFWSPQLEKPLDPVLAGGLAPALNQLGDWIESLLDSFLDSLGLTPLGTILDKILDTADALGDMLLTGEGNAANLDDLLGNLLSNPASVLGTLPQSLISGLESALESAGGAIADAIVQALGGSGTGHSAADVLAALGSIPQSVVSGLTDMATQSNQIRDILAGLVVTPINSAVQDIKDWFAGLGNKVQNLTPGGALDAENISGTIDPANVGGVGGASNIGDAVQSTIDDLVDGWNKFWDGIFGSSGSTNKTANDVHTAAASIARAVVAAQDSAITLANIANAPKNVPYWVSPNPFEDVAFPRSQLVSVTEFEIDSQTGATDPPNTGSHRHSMGGSSSAKIPIVDVAAGNLALIPIRTIQSRVYNSIGFITHASVAIPPTVLAGLYRLDPTTGLCTLEYDFGNIVASIIVGTGSSDTRISTVSDIIAAEGDMWAVGLLPIGGPLRTVAARKIAIESGSGIYPRFATSLVSGQSALPSSVADSSMAEVSGSKIWACVGQTVPEDTTPITLVDNFNVPDTTGWTSASWNRFLDSGTSGNDNSFGISSGRVYHSVAGLITYDSAYPSALHKTKLHLNDHASEITIGSGWDTSTYGKSTTRAYVRCRANGSAGVAMHLDNNGTNATRLRIATVAGPNQLGTVQTTVTGLPANVGDRFRIEAVDNVYTCYLNDVAIPGATWTDTGNVIAQGPNNRTTGWGVGSRRAIAFGSVAQTAMIDNWTSYDLAA